jgi:hypothetical protein
LFFTMGEISCWVFISSINKMKFKFSGYVYVYSSFWILTQSRPGRTSCVKGPRNLVLKVKCNS